MAPWSAVPQLAIAPAPVEGLLEADQSPDQRVVAGKGIATGLTEHPIELEFGVGRHDGRLMADQAGPAHPRQADGHEAGGDRASSGLQVRQTFADEVFTGQSREQVIGGHKGETGGLWGH